MITTIDHKRLDIGDVCRTLARAAVVARSVEQGLDLRPNHHIVLNISATGEHDPRPHKARFQLFLAGPCEIVSFSLQATMATRIIAAYDHRFILKDDGQEFWGLGPPGFRGEVSMTGNQAVKAAVAFFRKAK